MTERQQETTTLYARISGRVQGVGFRYFVLQHARRLGLTGRVRNLPNGDVEVHARGVRADLETLADLLHRGPHFSRVETVQLDWGVSMSETDSFEIDL